MNDRYLYRVKRTDNGEWVEGNLIHAKKDYYICENPYECMNEYSSLNGQSYGFGGFKFVDPSTICPCTGKYDIPENKMIYEHDFVSFLDTYSAENGYAEQYCVGEVLWDDEELCFYVTNRLSAESYEVLDDCKVIGNRFDNPELLEVGE